MSFRGLKGQPRKTRNFTLALTGSVVRTALRLSESEGVRVDLRDVPLGLMSWRCMLCPRGLSFGFRAQGSRFRA